MSPGLRRYSSYFLGWILKHSSHRIIRFFQLQFLYIVIHSNSIWTQTSVQITENICSILNTTIFNTSDCCYKISWIAGEEALSWASRIDSQKIPQKLLTKNTATSTMFNKLGNQIAAVQLLLTTSYQFNLDLEIRGLSWIFILVLY